MTDASLPPRLADVVADFEFVDRGLRAELLIEYADRFREVPPEVASRPFPESHRTPRCESDAFVWATDRADGTLQLHFAVENPQGLSAKAWAVILDETLSGESLERIVAVDSQVLYAIFGRDLSMGKGQGLMGMLDMVQHAARQRLAAGPTQHPEER